MKTRRDISKTTYFAAMKKHGFVSAGFMGYWTLPIEGKTIQVSDWNAGDNRRAKLAYMLQELEQELEKEQNELL